MEKVEGEAETTGEEARVEGCGRLAPYPCRVEAASKAMEAGKVGGGSGDVQGLGKRHPGEMVLRFDARRRRWYREVVRILLALIERCGIVRGCNAAFFCVHAVLLRRLQRVGGQGESLGRGVDSTFGGDGRWEFNFIGKLAVGFGTGKGGFLGAVGVEVVPFV